MNIQSDIKRWKVYVAYGSDRNDGAGYIKGLRPNIRAKVNFCETILEAYKEAIHVEHMF